VQTNIEFCQSSVEFWTKQATYDEAELHWLNNRLLEMFGELDRVKANLKEDQSKISFWQQQLSEAQSQAVYPPPTRSKCRTNITKS
jgi:chromosome segregation ATPase